jgi:hypothetical protein
MQFPMNFNDINLFFAITAIILLITSEILSTPNLKIGLIIERRRLRSVAIILNILFFSTILIRIIGILFSQ